MQSDPNGQFDYPQPGASAVDSFIYTVADAVGDTETASVTTTIIGVD